MLITAGACVKPQRSGTLATCLGRGVLASRDRGGPESGPGAPWRMDPDKAETRPRPGKRLTGRFLPVSGPIRRNQDRRIACKRRHPPRGRGTPKSVRIGRRRCGRVASRPRGGRSPAMQLSSNKLAQAADVITNALTSGARMPTYLIDQTVEALALPEEKRDLRRVTEAIIDTGGDPALDELVACDAALRHCPALADRLHKRAGADGRAAVNRAADLRSALRGFLHQGDKKAAGEVLDGLEGLAQDDVAVPEFLELLEDRASYELAWDLEDATIARARCHEDRSEFLEAMTVLRQDLFYRLATTESEDGLNDAAGILERIREYGIDPDYYSGMTSRYNGLLRQAEAEAPVEPDRAMPVRVLVVGGGEKQARAEDMVRSRLMEHHPHIRARFIRTGWSGNWSRPFSEIEREMKKHDALVIIRFMRTHLGREIRRTWDGPWRSCWGGGPGAIAEAVAKVADAVR